jgi:type III restriction enzyme
MRSVSLFLFQEAATAQMVEAVNDWISACAADGPPKLGRTPIPFLGLLKAVTGAGKTPILAKVCSEIGPAVVLWTSKSSAVVEQTYRNLQGKYRVLLPAGVRILRERPAKGEWEKLIGDTKGLTIWLTTVGSWNEAESAATGGSAAARLNMHRPHPDWGGEKSPWDQLRTTLKRPLWVVYDESHNQTPTQLDQLVGLNPVGFLTASATPPASELFAKFDHAIRDDPVMGPIAARGRVIVKTSDVVKEELLKHTLEVLDFQSEPEPMLDDVIERFKKLERAVAAERIGLSPKAVYVVEESNPRRGSKEVARPIAIWQYLQKKKVPADQIALYTQTKDVPDDAEKVSSLSALQHRHRHIIFNRALQEGWDDPEAYLCYFDGETNSYTRIQQIVGRVLRQPSSKHWKSDTLNTATLFIRVPNTRYEEIIDQIKKELSLYAVDETDPYGASAIRLKTRKAPLPAVPVKAAARKLKLPTYVLGNAELDQVLKRVNARGRSLWAEEDLLAAGMRRARKISLDTDKESVKFAEMVSNSRTPNADFFRRRLMRLNRWAAHQVHADYYSGESFQQRSCVKSVAQEELGNLAAAVVETYETTVQFRDNEIDGEGEWRISEHRPTGSELVTFRHATHAKYGRSAFNQDELEFAQALDSFGKGIWCRNPSSSVDGWSLPLPAKVGDSNSFYPDFLWWVKKSCFAIDPTGRQILEEKIRGKLLALNNPRIALVTRGRITSQWTRTESEGWTLLVPREGMKPSPEYFGDLPQLLSRLYKEA